MVNPETLQTELDILEEKIETIEHLLKGKKQTKSDMDHFLGRKLAEYREQYDKLKHNLTDLVGDDRGAEPDAGEEPGAAAETA